VPNNPTAPLPADVAMGEIWRSQQRAETAINAMSTKLDNMVSHVEYDQDMAEVKTRIGADEIRLANLETRVTVTEERSNANSEKISSISTAQAWTVTTVIGAIIVAVINHIMGMGT
jgi:uncharacterized protein YhaN